MGNDVLPATQIAGLVSRAVFLIACEEEMYIPLTSLMEGAEPIHIDCIVWCLACLYIILPPFCFFDITQHTGHCLRYLLVPILGINYTRQIRSGSDWFDILWYSFGMCVMEA